MTTQTIAERIAPSAVDDAALEDGYGPMLALVRELIGVVPNCDPWLEIWPPGFRTYNLIVPNFLNLPAMLFGRGAPKDLVGLGMYASSRAADCAYCSAHTCSFALRRGASEAAVTGEARSPAERAVVDLAEALSNVPSVATEAHLADVRAHVGEQNTDWIALGIAMMGFLNKFMDAMGIELEREAVADVAELIEPTGWAQGQHRWSGDLDDPPRNTPPIDSLRTYARVLRQGPLAARVEARWRKDVPKKPELLAGWLRGQTGADLPLLGTFGPRRVRRAVAAILVENLSVYRSQLGVPLKAAAGDVFTTAVDNPTVAAWLSDLAAAHPLGDRDRPRLDLCREYVAAISSSPAAVSDDLGVRVVGAFDPAEIIELNVWISVLQLLHRWDRYQQLRAASVPG